jgi:serine phosphatase RsbU (regulator of sigma subunit)
MLAAEPAARALTLPAPVAGIDHRVLLVEDDDGDAFLVEELLRDSDEVWSLTRARSIADAVRLAPSFSCALVDLGLPDSTGLDALAQLRAVSPDLAIVVLTGLNDGSLGLAAVAEGAQDYLVKGDVDGIRLARAVRYAIERRRAEVIAQQLLLAARRQDENDRLARGLLPLLRLADLPIDAATRYRPGTTAVLGGDFFDAIAAPDGSVRAVIGDVCGHGPSEAALGVALRIAWRTMTVDERPAAAVLSAVDAILSLERDDAVYATLCDVTIESGLRRLVVRRHGHPPPLLLRDGRWSWLEQAEPAPPLGVGAHRAAPSEVYELGADWALLLVTDGAYEGWAGDHRLGMDGLLASLDELSGRGLAGTDLLAALALETARADGRRHDDDVALLWLCPRS